MRMHLFNLYWFNMYYILHNILVAGEPGDAENSILTVTKFKGYVG